MVKGKVIKITKHYDNFYTLQIELEDGTTKKLGGDTPQVQKNNFYEFKTFVKGKYTNIISYKEYTPKKETEIINFLCNIDGVGKKTGQKIYDHLGEETINLLLDDVNHINDVQVSKKIINSVKEYIQEKQKYKDIISKLEQLGINVDDSHKLIDLMSDKHTIVEDVIDNPYILIKYLDWTFHKADRLAMQIQIDSKDHNRIASGIRYILIKNQEQGHSCINYYELENELAKLLDLDKLVIQREIYDIELMEGQEFLGFEKDNDLVFLIGTHYAETMNAYYLKELVQADTYIYSESDIDRCIDEYQLDSGILLDKQQREAVYMVFTNTLSLLDGKPGAGKTTTLSAIMYVANNLHKKPLNVRLSAPTGKAARRITQQTGFNAKTIHQMLEVVNHSGKNLFTYNHQNQLDVDLILVDEMSMVDMFLFHDLIKAIKKGTKILFVGDKDQLQSVVAGRVFEDMIESKVLPQIQLNENYRQSEGSYITKNANLLNQLNPMGIPNVNDRSDFKLYQLNESTLLNETINFAKICYKKYGQDVYQYFQAITPYKNGVMGVFNLNKELQKIFNPASADKLEINKAGATYRVGDKVMQLKNDKDFDINNGEDGVIKEVYPSERVVVVDFNGELIRYDFKEMEKIQHSFCITIHKSQGSEYPIVYIPMTTEKLLTYTKRLVYTAMTRAKNLLILAGNTKVLDHIYSTKEQVRMTNFVHYIQKEFNYEENETDNESNVINGMEDVGTLGLNEADIKFSWND
ncbi:AAA family ATPase [Alkalibacillus sp. S2W]|uniref:SF1B family DNA helicase RecD2 n=1 Tax=Alkalibacillus sp. S2W TaxID=3386553 RepID=UPI00398CC22A